MADFQFDPISDSVVEDAWREVSSVGDGSRARLLLDEFSRTQPDLHDFVTELATSLESDGAPDLAFFSALVVWRCFARATRGGLRPVGTSEILQQHARARAWVDAMQTDDPVILEKKIRDEKRYAEPHVMRYVMDAVFESHEDGIELEAEDEERLFLALKILVDLFAAQRSAKG